MSGVILSLKGVLGVSVYCEHKVVLFKTHHLVLSTMITILAQFYTICTKNITKLITKQFLDFEWKYHRWQWPVTNNCKAEINVKRND